MPSLGLGLGFARGPVSSAPPPLVLDSLTPQRAYSMRRLRTAYAGAAIRVRRSSDNTEQDIGFSGNALDTSALLAFAGSGSAFIRTFYDQMGNANWEQTTQANQPRIVNAGVIDATSGYPEIVFTDNSTQSLTQPPFLYAAGAMTILAVASSATPGGLPRDFIGEAGAGSAEYLIRTGAGLSQSNIFRLTNDAATLIAFTTLDSTVWDGTARSLVYKDTGSAVDLFENGNIQTTAGYTRSGVLTLNRLNVGNLVATSIPLRLREVIIFSSAISNPNQNTIAQNQGAHYGITVNPI